MVLTRKAAEVAGLVVISRLLAQPPPHFDRRTPRSDAPPIPSRRAQDRPSLPFEMPVTPAFITEIVDGQAHFHRAQLPDGSYLFAGFYSDGRVRLATPDGRRFSGIMMDQRAVIADLREDVSFEMGVAVHAHADNLLMLEMDGGPWDGQTLQCETV
jgi:hypothetical protein